MSAPVVRAALVSELPVKRVERMGVLHLLLAHVGHLDLLGLLPALEAASFEGGRELDPTLGLDQLDIICAHLSHLNKLLGLPIPLRLRRFLHIRHA